MIHRALKMAFWVTYDHLGTLVIWNALGIGLLVALGILSASLPGYLGLPVLAADVAIVLPALLAVLGHVGRNLIERREAGLSTLVEGARFALPGAVVGLEFSALIALSLLGVYYYLVVIGRPTPIYGYALAAVCFWAAVCFAAAYFFALPAVAQRRAGALAAVKTGFLLAVDNPLFTAAMLLHAGALLALALMPPVLLLFSFAPLAMLQSAAYEILARKYAAPLVNGKRVIDYRDAEDDLLNRGLRDFFFPWKG